MKKGKFIVFEGIDGCGKTTQLELVADYLETRGIEVIRTREPGGDEIAEKIRRIILDPDNTKLCSKSEVLLYLASRAQHVFTLIKPAVESGKTVLCDRFDLATFAYQGYGRGFEVERLKEFNKFAADSISPDLTLIFDISVEEARSRMERSGKTADRMEQSAKDFFQRVRHGFLDLSKESKGSVVVDASYDLDKVFEVVSGHINANFEIKTGSEC